MSTISMPHSKHSKSLRTICLNELLSVAINKPYLLSDLVLPPSVSSDVIETAYAEQLKGRVTTLQYADIVRLFSRTLTELTLELVDQYCGESSVTLHETTRSLLRRIAERTDPNYFRSLTIYGHWLPWKQCDLSRTISCVTGLRHLTLYVRELSDVVIKAIAISCRELEDLRLQGTAFTDCGLKSLAGYVWTSGAHEPNQIGCPNLRAIIMTESHESLPKFSYFSISALIDHLLNLRTISLPNDFVTKSITDLIRIKPSRIIQLVNLKCSAQFIISHIRSLPNISTITLIVTSTYDFTNLICLKELQHLHSVILMEDADIEHVTDFDYSNFRSSYNTTLYDLLKAIGHKINQLEIHLELCLDIFVIGSLCPQLMTLEVTNVFTISDERVRNYRCTGDVSLFSSLRNLKLLANSENKISERDLSNLLINCYSLCYLFIGWCDTFGDSVIDKVLNVENVNNVHNCRLRKLTQIELHEMSNSLTKIGIQQLVFSLPNIKSINLLGCEDLSSFDIMELCAIVNSLNLDVDIKYQSW